MMMKSSLTLRITAAIALVLSASDARAILLDHGPADPVLVFPTWYRDLNGVAVKECLSAVPSPNAAGGGKPMCFPANPDPVGFAGNVGPEIFYNAFNAALSGPSFTLRYVAALEGAYLPAGVPVHGTEAVFGRVRIVISTQTPGLYKVTHPYGVDVFSVSAANLGPKAVFFTADVPLAAPLNFDAALNGRIGPWLQWDFVDVGLTLTNSAGEVFLSDPNISHTYVGSPFGTNFVRVDGPAGSNISGIGDDFMQTPLGTTVGQVYTAPIPTPLAVQRATYSRDPVKNVIGVDVYAATAPGNSMILSGAGLPSVKMLGDASGKFFAHVELPATAIPPASVLVTNTTSNPVNSLSAALIDLVEVQSATFDTLTRVIKVSATSSDLLAPGPALTVTGPFGGPLVAGAFTSLPLAAGVLPPSTLAVLSGAGGTDSESVAVLPGLPDNAPFQPIAVADAFTLSENTAAALALTANDAVTPPAVVGSVLVLVPPANGTAVPSAVTPGTVTYTPAANFFGADGFQYVIVDSTGQVSNVATVTLTVAFVAVGPTASPDDFAMLVNRALPLLGHRVDVLANDVAAAGTVLDAASVKITTLPLHGTVVVSATGSVTYTPVLNYVGADSFRYTVANAAGVASTPATVSTVVEGGAESLSISKATYKVSTAKWTLVGATNWFGPTLAHTTATCWVGKGIAVGALIGTAPVDGTGKFSVIPATLTSPAPDATNIFTCQTSNGGSISFVVQRI